MARGCLTCVPTKISPNDFQEKYTNDDENGFYKFDKTENMTEFFKAEGFPDHVIKKTLRNMEIYWKFNIKIMGKSVSLPIFSVF